MECQQYISYMKEFQNLLLEFLENKEDSAQDYENLIFVLQTKHNLKDRMHLYEVLRLISNMTQNHHLFPNFETKIKQILLFLKNDIKKTFSNFDISNIFKNNKLILLILLDIKITTIDESVNSFYYQYYFSPEIEEIVDNEMKEMIQNDLIEFDESTIIDFDKKRRIGSNDSNICKLIRNDSIEDFIIFVNRTNISLQSTKINHSIFETNVFLINKKPTFIEYAAFYGSIQIYQYLRLNNVHLDSMLWLYSIHSKNAELIHLLEEDHIQPPENSYLKCLEEAVKCHHNDIAKYIQDNYLSKEMSTSFSPYCFQYYNYDLFPIEITNCYENFFKYDYIKIVSILLKMESNSNCYENFFKYDYIKIVSILLKMESNDIDKFIDKVQFLPLSVAVQNGCSEIVNFLYELPIKKINKNEFYRCDKLKEFSIPSSVTSIGMHAFEESSLVKLSIPSSVVEIENSAFRRCLALRDLTFLASVEIIERDVFRECISLTEVTIPSSVKIIESWSFHGCTSLKEVIFKENSCLTSIGEFAFYSCIKLEQISIPSSVKAINQCAFESCISLKHLNFENPSSLEFIGAFAFKGCISLSSFCIPSSVTSIGKHAFEEHAFNLANYIKCNICYFSFFLSIFHKN